jgi:hypothetical protein
MRKTLLALTIGFVFIGCRSSGGGNTGPDGSTGTDGNSGGDGGVSTTVKAIRMNQPTTGTILSLSNVVVVAHVTSKKSGHVWVQDAGGGTYSGIHVFCNYGGTTPSCTMTQMQIDALAVGTVVNLSGKFNSFLLSGSPAGAQPELEIESPTITATGTTMAPVAVDVAASVVAKAQFMPGNSDPYKGAYVHVTGGPYPVSNATAPEFSAACTSSMGMAGTTFAGFEATGGGQTLAIGLGYYNTLTYCIPQCGFPCTNQITTQSFTSVSGVVEPDYNKNGMVYLKISPVVDTDLAHP